MNKKTKQISKAKLCAMMSAFAADAVNILRPRGPRMKGRGEELQRTDRAQAVMKYAEREAKALGHRYVGTEHILLSLAKSEGVAGYVLKNMGLSAKQVRKAVLELLGHG